MNICKYILFLIIALIILDSIYRLSILIIILIGLSIL